MNLLLDACSSEPEEGTCNRQTTKYYFDTSSRQCQQFVYTGCGGNPNRFSSSEECESICLQNEEPPIPYGENTEHVNEGGFSVYQSSVQGRSGSLSKVALAILFHFEGL